VGGRRSILNRNRAAWPTFNDRAWDISSESFQSRFGHSRPRQLRGLAFIYKQHVRVSQHAADTSAPVVTRVRIRIERSRQAQFFGLPKDAGERRL
jgi:hypothetical protein